MKKLRAEKARQKAPIRSTEEINFLRESGRITARALKKTIKAVEIGKNLLELDKIAEEEILKLGGQSSFKSVPGYFWTTCLTVNEEVVHGIPRDIILNQGDILNIDLGAIYPPVGGWHTDAAWTVIVGQGEEEKKMFLKVGEETLWKAINEAVKGKRIGDISHVIQENIKKAGYSVVKSLAGHGIGKNGHEEPEVPEYGEKGTGLKLESGMSLAIEVIYTKGKGDVYQKDDRWTVASVDHSWGGLFEMSVIVNQEKAEVLTDWRKV